MTRTVSLGDVSVGTALPELPVPVTTTMIIAGALASRDFTPLHHDTTNILFCQVWGKKRVTLVSPLHAPLLDTASAYYSTLNLELPRTRRNLAAQGARLLDVDLGPGEALFIPAGWWHHVRSKSVSISVSLTNFVFPNSFAQP